MGLARVFVLSLSLLFLNCCFAYDVESFFTADELLYVGLEEFGVAIASGQSSLLFKVRACNDARLLLMQEQTNVLTNLYEIVIGGLANTKSWIAESQQGCPVQIFTHTSTPLHCNFPRSFWVSWTAAGVITVGTGGVVGNNQFLSYTDVTSPTNINYIAASTGLRATGHWQFQSPSTSPPPADCKALLDDEPSTPSGVYTIKPCASCDTFEVYCDMDTDGGGWTVFQRRQDGSTSFGENWNSYKDGFGAPSGEYWLGSIIILYKVQGPELQCLLKGLEHLYQILNQGAHEMRVDMEDWASITKYAKYSTFSIGPENVNYRLTIAGYSGDAGDSLTYHNNQQFSAPGTDNDAYSGDCTALYEGGWWYKACHYSNLNGRYVVNGNHNSEYAIGINWRTWHGYYYALKKTEMKIRRTS